MLWPLDHAIVYFSNLLRIVYGYFSCYMYHLTNASLLLTLLVLAYNFLGSVHNVLIEFHQQKKLKKVGKVYILKWEAPPFWTLRLEREKWYILIAIKNDFIPWKNTNSIHHFQTIFYLVLKWAWKMGWIFLPKSIKS